MVRFQSDFGPIPLRATPKPTPKRGMVNLKPFASGSETVSRPVRRQAPHRARDLSPPLPKNLNDGGGRDPTHRTRRGSFGGLTSLLETTRHEGPATRVAMRRRCEGLILALWGSPAPSAITATHRMHLQLMIYHISTSRILLVLNAKASRKSALNWQRRCGR